MDDKRIRELTQQVAQLLAENNATKYDADKIFSGLDGYLVVSNRANLVPQSDREPEAVPERGRAKMRTAAGVVAELKALDPGTDVTVSYVRSIIKAKKVPVVEVGCKKLVDVDAVMTLLQNGAPR